MKKNLFVFILVLFSASSALAADENPLDTNFINKRTQEIAVQVNALHDSLDKTRKEMRDSLHALNDEACDCVPVENGKIEDGWPWFLILSPFVLLLLIILVAAIYLRNFKFSEALTENDPPKKVIKNPEYNAAIITANAAMPNLSVVIPPTIEISNVEPGLTEIRETVSIKRKAFEVLRSSIDEAQKNTTVLDEALGTAQSSFDTVNGDTEGHKTALTAAQESLAQLEAADAPDQAAITTAKEVVMTAEAAVTKNAEDVAAATLALQQAKDALSAHNTKLGSMQAMLAKGKEDADAATRELENAESLAKGGSVYSAGTYRASISRYIAFITSLVAILLIVCMSSFFLYHYIKTQCPPDFGALSAILIALGLGITPYVTNKISKASAKNS